MKRSDLHLLAKHYPALLAEELEFCARAIQHMDSGATASRWLRRRIAKLTGLTHA